MEWFNISNDPPTIQLLLPQVNQLEKPKSIQASATNLHEWMHASLAIERWRNSGSFVNNDKMTEELKAEFNGDVAEIFLAKSLGLIDSIEYRESVKNVIDLDGSYLPYIGWYLDSQSVTSESSLWKILYESHSYYYYSSMAIQYGHYADKESAQQIRTKWESYPWTEAEKQLLYKMFQEGMEQGFIKAFAYPDFPE